MLVGREPERQQIARLVSGARLGESGVLILRGEAGIGKTALLDDTAHQALDMAIMRTAGSERESALGFSGLHQLLQPALHLIDHIPGPQSDALAVALMLRRGPVPERFAIGAATLSLLSRYAEDAPVLVLVDDAHLLDPPTAETLRFVARRLVADALGLVIATRPDPDGALADTNLPTLELTGLDLAAATSLIDASRTKPAGTDVASRLHAATAGNPLAIVELSGEVDSVAWLPPQLPLPVPQTVARAFAQRVATLPDAARVALLVAVVADGDLSVTSVATEMLGSGIGHLASAEAIGLLHLGAERAEFRHPLVRSAVYATADHAARREAHRAVAAAVPGTAQDARAWHLSEACVGPDNSVAEAVFELAERARARGAHSVAAMAFARSSELTSDHAVRSLRLAAAGESAWFAGKATRATELLQQAAALTSDPAKLAEIDGLRGNVAIRTGSPREAYWLLTKAASHAETADADVAAHLLTDAVAASLYLCDAAAGLRAAKRLELLLRSCRTPSARIRAQMAIGVAHVLAGRPGVHWIRLAVLALLDEPGVVDDPYRPDWTFMGTLFLRESVVGRELIRAVVQERRTRTAIGALPCLLFHTARDDATTDRWPAALISYDESISLATETGQTTDQAVSLAGLAWLQARMGRTEECRANAAKATEMAERQGITFAKLWAQFALGDLALAQGDTSDAIAQYTELYSAMRTVGFDDVDVAPGPELAEAQLRQGELAEARQTASEYMCQAQGKGQPWALARAHRAVASTTDNAEERKALFEKALAFHTQTPDLFEEARTRLCFGAALRRDKGRADARKQLRLALAAFERLGARPWADYAASELLATGERARRSGGGYLDVLTSQEIRIAQMLGAGKTTKEAAAALFLSPKTVEYHLRHIYQKLAIGSRHELTAVLATHRAPKFGGRASDSASPATPST
jgi:DNA-binding CsgD family transcriptional regulator